MIDPEFESILVVFQNPEEGRLYAYDDWYTNVHIRDAMRLDGAIATQRFIVHDEQLILNGTKVAPVHWAHTIYEWQSAAKSVQGHLDRAGTPLMDISHYGSFAGLRDYFFRPVFLSHGWSREAGFRLGSRAVLTAMIVPEPGSEAAFINWFSEVHAPATLAMPGFATAGLFVLHDEQSLPHPSHFSMVAIYGLSDASQALAAWGARHDAVSDEDLGGHVAEVETTCWQQRIDRLRAETVANASADAKANEHRAREAYRDSYLTADVLFAGLAG